MKIDCLNCDKCSRKLAGDDYLHILGSWMKYRILCDDCLYTSRWYQANIIGSWYADEYIKDLIDRESEPQWQNQTTVLNNFVNERGIV